MSARKLFYLGPQGTFTHQAAVNASQALAHLEPEGFDWWLRMTYRKSLMPRSGAKMGRRGMGKHVEGYVVPNLDALIDAKDLVGFARVGVDVTLTHMCVRDPIRKTPPWLPHTRMVSRNANVSSRNTIWNRLQRHPMLPHVAISKQTK